ncbi:MAG: hypothetical protein E7390_01720 [Ruminococcaceae bacterium]|nr:hypothetical protein [Oscillospiraceae bacterium]
MKKLVGIFLAITMGMSMLMSFAVTAKNEEVFAVTEDFEDALDSTWSSSAVLDTTEYRGGQQSLKIETTDKAIIINWKIPVQSETKYVVNAWTKLMTAGTGGAELKAVHYNATGTGTEEKMFITVDTNSTDWQEVTSEFTTLADTVTTHLYVRNTKTQNTLWWDDITVSEYVPEKHPELLPAIVADCDDTSVWGKGSSDSYEIHEDTAANRKGILFKTKSAGGTGVISIACQSGNRVDGLKEGTAYRLSFWFKTDSTNKPCPFIRIIHTYSLNTNPDTTTTIQQDINKAYIQYLAGGNKLGSDTRYTLTDGGTDWKRYEVYFTVPGGISGYTYVKSSIGLGQSGSKNGDAVASVYFDDVSLKEDYDEITFLDETGKAIEELTGSQTVKARVHLAPSTDKVSVLTGHYNTMGVKQLKGVETGEIVRGAVYKDGISETETVEIKNLVKGKLILPIADPEYSFAMGANEAVGVYLWNSFAGMKPIEKATISVAAADAAE